MTANLTVERIEPRDLGDHVTAEADRDGAITLTLRSAYGFGEVDRITLQPETQRALLRYMNDLHRPATFTYAALPGVLTLNTEPTQ